MPSQKKKPQAKRQDVRRDQTRFQDLLEHLPVGVYRTTPGGELIEAMQS